MSDRLSLKAILLAGCCIAVPLSYATGENSNGFPVLGNVLPASAATQTLMPATAPTALPPGLVTSPVMPTAPILPAPVAQPVAILPTQPQAAAAQPPVPVPVQVRNVAPGENPFVPVAVARPQAAPVIQAMPANLQPVATPSAPAQAQTAPDTAATLASLGVNVPQESQQKAKVDETALRYYAQSRDLKRLGAELRRLKALYPEWEAPEDLFDAPTNISEQPLWDIYGQGDYVQVRSQIARMQSENPSWKPSQELLDKLALGETRKLIERAHGLRNWAQVITLAEATPQLMVCAEMNSMWLTAEALAQSRDFARSFDLYKYILSTCEIPDERLATVQKASLVMPESGTQSLIALGRLLPDGTNEFENVGYNMLRAKMGQIAQGATTATGLSMDELQKFSDYVQRAFSADDAALFAWFYYGQQNWEASYHWFIAATQMSHSPKNIEGVVLTLRNMTRQEEALQIARQYSTQTPELKKIYIELVSAGLTDQENPMEFKPEELAEVERFVFEQKSALGAQALGWHKLDQKEPKEASRLFKQSVEWEPTEGGVVGLAVLAARAKNWGTVASIKKEYEGKFAALADVKVYRAKTTLAKKPPPKPEKPNLLTWLFKPEERSEKKPRVATE